MTKTFTYDDVVRYIYSETTQDENRQIVIALAMDDNLMDFYLDSLKLQESLDSAVANPTGRAIQRILDYSNSWSIYPITEIDTIRLG